MFGQVLVVPKAHALAKKRKIALEELRGVPLVLPPRGRAHRDRIAAAFPEGEGAIDVVAEADGWHLMLEFAARGLGAAIVNDYCRLPDGLVGVPVPQLPTQSLFACRRADEAHRGEAAEALWSRLPKALRART
jgi:DNA-binding transcriptional LysR family regulator